MSSRLSWHNLSSFQRITICFLLAILSGTALLSLPISNVEGIWVPLKDTLFTATSAVCVTGLVVQDTAQYWTLFGQIVILILIQIGGLGVVTFAAFLESFSGRKIDLTQRNTLQNSLSAHQIGGMVKMTRAFFLTAFLMEAAFGIIMLPTFCKEYGASGIWMAFFHSVSAFCNAGFDVMGASTGAYSSLTSFSTSAGVTVPICLLIIFGGIGFLTLDDIRKNKLHFNRYRMQSKVILTATAGLIIIPALLLFIFDFNGHPLNERICLSLFQAITPRTAGFNTADLTELSGGGRMMTVVLMLIGGSPGSTAGGIKTTSAVVLIASSITVIRQKKSVHLFGRRVEDDAVRTACTLLMMYLLLFLGGAVVLSNVEGLPLDKCLFETASAIGTVGLSLGITPRLGFVSRLILVFLMFWGRVGGLTLIYAASNLRNSGISQYPKEKITVG